MKTLPLIFALLFLALPPSAAGFGKNKVQYEHMAWQYLQASHYTLYFHQDQGTLPEITYTWLDDIYADLAKRFDFTHERPVPTIIYGAPALFEQTNIITAMLPEGVGGFTEIFKNRIAVPFNGSFHDLRHVLHHEMVHAFVFGAVYGGGIFGAASANVPLWFNEGLAEILSSGWNRNADMYMLDRVLHSNVPPPGHALNHGFIAYKGGQSFLYYLYSIGGEALFNQMLIEFKETRAAERSIERVYEKSLEDLGTDWINELRRIYWPEIGRRMLPSDHATPITNTAADRSRFNLRPRISPDGQSIAFFSDRRDYTRIIITDTTGRELRRIGGQHGLLGGSFESFQPMSGSLSWSPDGSELAFVVKRGGRNEIRIVNARNGRRQKTITPPLAAITGLDWSRDGRYMAMTAIEQGQTGLYIYDIEASELTVLDQTPGTKAAPRFSPDGTKIIFTETDTVGLGRGPFASTPWSTSNIAIYDIKTKLKYLLTDNEWNDKQAAFSPDGEKFVFVSDRNGIDNLYIASIDDPENPRPLTDYTGNVANPDWAADGSAIVFDNFMRQSWNIWHLKKPEENILESDALAMTRWAMHEESNGQIPFFEKRGRRENVSDNAEENEEDDVGSDIDIADDSVRSPIDTIPDPRPYRLRFTPDLVIFGLGISTYSGASGQAAAMFSDIMGDHRVTLAGDMQIDLTEYAQIYAVYEYLKLRFDLFTGGFYNKYYSYDYSYDGHRHRFYHDLETGGFVGVRSPFSMFSRVDAQFFGRHLQRKPFVLETDQLISDHIDPNTIDNNDILGIFGYSFDNILWGITGPLRGFRGRARLQIAPPLGFTDEAYISGDIDLRNYTHVLRRFVWANRVKLGATAGLDGNRAARRFFLGGDHNWIYYGIDGRNYDDNLQYSYYSDIVTPLRGWNYFARAGDRMMLMNSEFRFPFIREISTVWPIPMSIRYINGAVFADAGSAWEEDIHGNLPPEFIGGYGFGMRANLGIFVLRYDRGWPIDWAHWKRSGRPINYFSFGAEF
ncbi:MAG: BamA/TamA family outer membrane protein [Chitinispirillales bacterium]|jgi:Tol biopolymer transport system component|nr:BamA/TamA family outer membrane protein [Chitinispirillales bacterium]